VSRYRIELTRHAAKSLPRLDRPALRRVQAALDLLADNPRPPRARALAQWPAGTYRVRTGDYRILYEIHDDVLLVLVVRVGHRRDVFR